MVGVYKLTSSKISGALYLYYDNKSLRSFQSELNKPLTEEQWKYLREKLPLQEDQVTTLEQYNLVVQPIKGKSVQDKVILFCMYYKHYRGTSYAAKTLEKANLKGIPVTEDLLTIFFNSPLQNFTLKNYIDRINITKDHLKNGVPGDKLVTFPAYFDEKFEKTLNQEQTTAYHAHLISLGWAKHYNPNAGNVWHKKADNTR